MHGWALYILQVVETGGQLAPGVTHAAVAGKLGRRNAIKVGNPQRCAHGASAGGRRLGEDLIGVGFGQAALAGNGAATSIALSGCL